MRRSRRSWLPKQRHRRVIVHTDLRSYEGFLRTSGDDVVVLWEATVDGHTLPGETAIPTRRVVLVQVLPALPPDEEAA